MWLSKCLHFWDVGDGHKDLVRAIWKNENVIYFIFSSFWYWLKKHRAKEKVWMDGLFLSFVKISSFFGFLFESFTKRLCTSTWQTLRRLNKESTCTSWNKKTHTEFQTDRSIHSCFEVTRREIRLRSKLFFLSRILAQLNWNNFGSK